MVADLDVTKHVPNTVGPESVRAEVHPSRDRQSRDPSDSTTWGNRDEPRDTRRVEPDTANHVVCTQVCLVGRCGTHHELHRHCRR